MYKGYIPWRGGIQASKSYLNILKKLKSIRKTAFSNKYDILEQASLEKLRDVRGKSKRNSHKHNNISAQ